LADTQTAEVRSRLSALEERAGQQGQPIAALQLELFTTLARVLSCLTSELGVFRDAKNNDTVRPAATASRPGAPAKSLPTAAPVAAAPLSRLESLIVSEFSPLFQEFHAKRFNLLWRRSRDGFGAAEFHRRCDGRANTLTLILDTEGNVSGGDWMPRRRWLFTGRRLQLD
jgi:hypothetical protein